MFMISNHYKVFCYNLYFRKKNCLQEDCDICSSMDNTQGHIQDNLIGIFLIEIIKELVRI